MIYNIITPTIISIITTTKCTASCANCCFKCNPENNKRLSLDDMIDYINQSLSYFPTIRVLVLTGGECMLLGKDLFKIIEYGRKKT